MGEAADLVADTAVPVPDDVAEFVVADRVAVVDVARYAGRGERGVDDGVPGVGDGQRQTGGEGHPGVGGDPFRRRPLTD